MRGHRLLQIACGSSKYELLRGVAHGDTHGGFAELSLVSRNLEPAGDIFTLVALVLYLAPLGCRDCHRQADNFLFSAWKVLRYKTPAAQRHGGLQISPSETQPF